jgi:hypothetical protein
MAAAAEMGCGVKRFILLGVLSASLGAAGLHATTYYVTIAGLGGEPEYEQRFSGWAKDIDKAVKGAPDSKSDTLFGPEATREAIRTVLVRIGKEAKATDALVVMLIGHGTFDGSDYKINLPGPDLSAIELATMLDRVPAGRQLVVNMTSASGGAIEALRKPNRVIISATKSGTERNATVFARYWVEALHDPAADADKNGRVSMLEAFMYASAAVRRWYDEHNQLPTERPLIADGDGVGREAPDEGAGGSLARGTYLQVAGEPVDAPRRALAARQAALEAQVDALKARRSSIAPDAYQVELERLLLDLARISAELRSKS